MRAQRAAAAVSLVSAQAGQYRNRCAERKNETRENRNTKTRNKGTVAHPACCTSRRRLDIRFILVVITAAATAKRNALLLAGRARPCGHSGRRCCHGRPALRRARRVPGVSTANALLCQRCCGARAVGGGFDRLTNWRLWLQPASVAWRSRPQRRMRDAHGQQRRRRIHTGAPGPVGRSRRHCCGRVGSGRRPRPAWRLCVVSVARRCVTTWRARGRREARATRNRIAGVSTTGSLQSTALQLQQTQ